MIVALARKLLIALWRFVTDGGVPQGATMKPATSRSMRSGCSATAWWPGDRGNVAVVRRGTKNAVFTEWRRSFGALQSRKRDSGWDLRPARCEVCRQGSAERESASGTEIRNNLLTEKSSCEAGHLKATDHRNSTKLPLPKAASTYESHLNPHGNPQRIKFKPKYSRENRRGVSPANCYIFDLLGSTCQRIGSMLSNEGA